MLFLGAFGANSCDISGGVLELEARATCREQHPLHRIADLNPHRALVEATKLVPLNAGLVVADRTHGAPYLRRHECPAAVVRPVEHDLGVGALPGRKTDAS